MRPLHGQRFGSRSWAQRKPTLLVAQNRILAQDQPAVFWPELALSLNTLGIASSGLGRHHEALKVMRETAGLYRVLAQIHADAFSSGSP